MHSVGLKQDRVGTILLLSQWPEGLGVFIRSNRQCIIYSERGRLVNLAHIPVLFKGDRYHTSK